jgi:class 3 adenylate cyclase
MRCVNCGTALLAGKKFCHACGTPAGVQCRGCGANLQPEFRFCPDCGLAVAAADVHDGAPPPAEDPFARMSRHIPEALAQKIRAAQGTIEGERKQVTVLFCDLVGSTSLAERLDPEEYRELIEQYLELVFGQVYRCEGIVNVLAGDGVMALFGAPIAHEDAPRRAIGCALAINEAIAGLGARLERERGLQLRARIGVHTGPVVVGTVGNDLKMDYTAVGDTTNLAARLQTLAAPGTILLSEATQRLVRGFFELRPTGPLEVRGKSQPVEAYEVLGEASAATPMEIAAERGLTPFVGRDEELAQLAGSYARAANGLPQVVAVVGDAGSGKSRLLYEFRTGLEGEEVTVFEGRCSSLGHTVPYFPFTTMLRQHFDIRIDDSAASACAKIAARLGTDDDRPVCALARFLALSTQAGNDSSSEESKRESFDAVARLVLGESWHGPAVLMIEDLHWMDDASRELLEALLARLASGRLLVLLTHRPDDRPPFATRAAYTQVVLRRLSDDEIRLVIRAIAGGPLPESLESVLVAKAEGSPFFAEEITRALIEEGHLTTNGGAGRLTRPIEDIRIPGTVQEVIAARLDRLGPQAKRVAQVASVVGRQFSAPSSRRSSKARASTSRARSPSWKGVASCTARAWWWVTSTASARASPRRWPTRACCSASAASCTSASARCSKPAPASRARSARRCSRTTSSAATTAPRRSTR